MLANQKKEKKENEIEAEEMKNTEDRSPKHCYVLKT